MSRLELRQLAYFKAVAESENISATAKELYISQPALSKSIQQLEKELGVDLFVRNGKHLMINAAGREALQYTDRILEAVRSMQVKLKSIAANQISLRIGTTQTSPFRFVIPVFEIEHPWITTDTQFIGDEEKARESLEDGSFDAVLVSSVISGENVCSRRILSDSIFVCVPENSRMAGKNSVSLKELEGMTLLATRWGDKVPYVEQFNRRLLQMNVQVNFSFQPDFATLRMLLEKTDYCVISSSLFLTYQHLPGRIPVKIQDEEIGELPCYLAYCKEKQALARPLEEWLLSLKEKLSL